MPPITSLPGIGTRRASLLADVGIYTVSDLLLFLPYHYLDRTRSPRIDDLCPGQEVTVLGTVEGARILPGRRKRFVLYLVNESGRLACTWFSGHRYLPSMFSDGDLLAAAGKVSEYGGGIQMVHPEVEPLSEDGDDDRVHTGRIIPLYRTTAEMKAAGLNTRAIRRIIHAALDEPAGEPIDPIPSPVREAHGLMPLGSALRRVHFPDTMSEVEEARKRLAFEELLCLQLRMGQLRRLHASAAGSAFHTPGDTATRLIARLPFQLTRAQKQAVDAIWADLSRSTPMHRLLQGDVGSGKTLVALLAALPVVEQGAQAALMVPTELLAEQHIHSLRALVDPLGLRVDLLTGRMPAPEKRTTLEAIASGRARLVVGTHALLQADVGFRRLGLVVVDEQHRFGVMQRADLREKGGGSHLLVMTATPIPRSLALTLYGDLDVTAIDQLPPGRRPVKTGWRTSTERRKALSFISEQVALGRQAFIVYPTIEGSDGDLQAATKAYDALRRGPLKACRVELLHGRMPGDVQADVMTRFRHGQVDVLVCTTVVEVGVDVPNATVMMVRHAERFGLSQLHQLRGRVGRGPGASYCILMAEPQDELTPEARRRLDVMASTNDGFEIAERDLQIRGPGQVFGTRQAGFPSLRFADLSRDGDLARGARDAASELLCTDPDVRLPAHAGLKARLIALAEAGVDLVEEAG